MSDAKQLQKIADRLDQAADKLENLELLQEIEACQQELQEIPHHDTSLRMAMNSIGFIVSGIRHPQHPAGAVRGLRDVARALRQRL